MKKLQSILIFFLILNSYPVLSQLFPKENALLNYRIIRFSYISKQKSTVYKLEIAAGNFNSIDSFKDNVIKTVSGTGSALIAEVPFWSSGYTWQVTGKDEKSVLHHFATGTASGVDTTIIRLKVEQQALKYKDGYIFIDGTAALYDMEGHAVWYMPRIDTAATLPRDLKLSPAGTITYLADNKAYEVNYNGEILWQGPDNGKTGAENYHHELTRLNNGHYMVLGRDSVLWKAPADTSLLRNRRYTIVKGSNGELRQKIEFGTVAEYDGRGKRVWWWSSADYFKHSDLFSRRTPNGLFDLDVHENAFFFDQSRRYVYVSFKNISRILKVKYPEGTVVGTYGTLYKPGNKGELSNALFCNQHGCKVSAEGYLLVYDNGCGGDVSSSVVMMQEAANKKDSLQKVWEFPCPAGNTRVQPATSGGNVIQLPDQSLFVSMSSEYSKMFIVSHSKEILWSGFAEKWNPTTNRWNILSTYRASIITDRKQLERLIDGQQPKK